MAAAPLLQAGAPSALPSRAGREIVVDTETTGLSHREGDRIIEVAFVEVRDRRPTGKHWHWRFDPERPIPARATAIHGITDRDVAGLWRFHEGAGQILAILDTSPVVAHNAPFDVGFLDMELTRAGLPTIAGSGRAVVNTVALARQRWPGQKATLDAVLQRCRVDARHRVVHGALLDATLLADAYAEICGAGQTALDLASATPEVPFERPDYTTRTPRPPRVPTKEERRAHAALVHGLTNPIWAEYWSPTWRGGAA